MFRANSEDGHRRLRTPVWSLELPRLGTPAVPPAAIEGALRSVLHVLRNRLTPEQAVHLGAQLPLLVRGIFYEGWRIAGKPSDERHPVEFATLVAADLPHRWPATRCE
jgi:Uncharacterized conserved protein (DUF2267)